MGVDCHHPITHPPHHHPTPHVLTTPTPHPPHHHPMSHIEASPSSHTTPTPPSAHTSLTPTTMRHYTHLTPVNSHLHFPTRSPHSTLTHFQSLPVFHCSVQIWGPCWREDPAPLQQFGLAQMRILMALSWCGADEGAAPRRRPAAAAPHAVEAELLAQPRAAQPLLLQLHRAAAVAPVPPVVAAVIERSLFALP